MLRVRESNWRAWVGWTVGTVGMSLIGIALFNCGGGEFDRTRAFKTVSNALDAGDLGLAASELERLHAHDPTDDAVGIRMARVLVRPFVHGRSWSQVDRVRLPAQEAARFQPTLPLLHKTVPSTWFLVSIVFISRARSIAAPAHACWRSTEACSWGPEPGLSSRGAIPQRSQPQKVTIWRETPRSNGPILAGVCSYNPL